MWTYRAGRPATTAGHHRTVMDDRTLHRVT
jgi:hypothetical protein